MRFTKRQIQALYAIGRVHGHLWATSLDWSEVFRDGISDTEISYMVAKKWSAKFPGEPHGIAAPRASHTTTTGRTRWEVDYLGEVRCEVWRPELGKVISFEAEIGALRSGAPTLKMLFQDPSNRSMYLDNRNGVKSWVSQDAHRRHLSALMRVIRQISASDVADGIQRALALLVQPDEQLAAAPAIDDHRARRRSACPWATRLRRWLVFARR